MQQSGKQAVITSREQSAFAAMLRETPWLQGALGNEEILRQYPWLAMDKNGKVYAYARQPRPGSDIWISFDGSFLFIGLLAQSVQNLDFSVCCVPWRLLKDRRQAILRPACPSALPDLPDVCVPDAWL